MIRTTVAAIVGFVLGCAVVVSGQNPLVTNLAGVPFPVVQYSPNNLIARSHTVVNGMTRLEGVEIKTMGIIVRAGTADVDTGTGEYRLSGNVTAILVPIRPIWPNLAK